MSYHCRCLGQIFIEFKCLPLGKPFSYIRTKAVYPFWLFPHSLPLSASFLLCLHFRVCPHCHLFLCCFLASTISSSICSGSPLSHHLCLHSPRLQDTRILDFYWAFRDNGVEGWKWHWKEYQNECTLLLLELTVLSPQWDSGANCQNSNVFFSSQWKKSYASWTGEVYDGFNQSCLHEWLNSQQLCSLKLGPGSARRISTVCCSLGSTSSQPS